MTAVGPAERLSDRSAQASTSSSPVSRTSKEPASDPDSFALAMWHVARPRFVATKDGTKTLVADRAPRVSEGLAYLASAVRRR